MNFTFSRFFIRVPRQDRHKKYEALHEAFKNDPLAEVIADKSTKETLKETITVTVNRMMQALKEMMLKMQNKTDQKNSKILALVMRL